MNCEGAKRDPKKPGRTITVHTDPVEAEAGRLCFRCHTRLRRQISELPAVATWIEVNIAASSSSNQNEPVSGSSEDPIPLRLDALDLIGPAARDSGAAFAQSWLNGSMDDQQGDPGIEPVLRAHAERVHWEARIPWPDDSTITGFSVYLLTHLSWLVEQDWIDEFMAEINDLHARASRVAPWKPETRRVKDETCQDCGVRALVTHVAEGYTRCEKGLGGCGARREITEYAYRAYGAEAS